MARTTVEFTTDEEAAQVFLKLRKLARTNNVYDVTWLEDGVVFQTREPQSIVYDAFNELKEQGHRGIEIY